MRLKRGVVVLHRGPGVTQVGLARPVVIEGLTEHDQRSLALLEGGRLSPNRLSEAGRAGLAALDLAGHLVADSADTATERAVTVAIYGAGAIGMAAARSLARHGHVIEFADATPAVAESADVFTSSRAGDTCATAAARELLTSVRGSTVRVGATSPDAAVVIGVGAPDPVAWLPLTRSDIPHVLVAADEAGIDVGPLVIPGASTCGHCVAVARTAADPAWPLMRLQCGASRRPVVEAQAAELAGSLVAAMILAWVGVRGDEQAGGVSHTAWAVNAIWRVEAGQPPIPRPAWPQPDCGCGAAA